MGSTSIEWTDKTWQVTAGCTHKSPGCMNCWAEGMSGRLAAMAVADERAGKNPGRKAPYKLVVRQREGKELNGYGPKSGWNNNIITLPGNLTIPFGWKKPCRIFVNSQSDLFHPDVPFEFVDQVFAIMALCPQHTFQVLTKRPERMAEYVRRIIDDEFDGDGEMLWSALEEHEKHWPDWSVWTVRRGRGGLPFDLPLSNVWLGTSVENQEAANKRIPELLRCPAVVRFISAEPLLGALDFADYEPFGRTRYYSDDDGIDWVIAGGESGPNARPMHPDWARSIRDQCQAAGVPFFFKQFGEWQPIASPQGLRLGDCCIWSPHDGRFILGGDMTSAQQHMLRVGKKAAGRMLDGRTWDEFPTLEAAHA